MLVKERNTDILCKSESWLLTNVPDEFVKGSGYHIFVVIMDVVVVCVFM